MNNFYGWAMRNAAPILFGLAGFIFLVGLAQALVELGRSAGDVSFDGTPVPVSERSLTLLMVLAGALRAATSAVLPFAAAAALHRWDRQPPRPRNAD